MQLRTCAPKARGSWTRELDSEGTLARIRPHFLRAGITRIADITGLDRIGIPVFSAVCPRSNDTLSVYNGKGATPTDARTSAAMEAIERFSAGLPRHPSLIASYAELEEAGIPAVSPRDYNLTLSRHYRDGLPISWLAAWDMLRREEVLVPHCSVIYGPSYHEPPAFEIATTNGLASGNSLEEALCHGLCELVERDAMTLATLISGQLPRALEQTQGPSPELALLRNLNPHVDMETLPDCAMELIDRFRAADLSIRLVCIGSDLGLPTFLAQVAEDLGPTLSSRHWGFGCHPDAGVAVTRAITECAQSRAVDIQAVREDISLSTEEVSRHRIHVQRAVAGDLDSWSWKPTSCLTDWSTIPSFRSGDVVQDLDFILDRLVAAGIDSVLAVDLSPPQIPVSVVRTIVPALESYAVDRCKLGPRATQAWRSALARVAPNASPASA